MKKKVLILLTSFTLVSSLLTGCNTITKNALENKSEVLMTIGGSTDVPLEDSFILANEVASDYNKIYGDINDKLNEDTGNGIPLKERLKEDILKSLKEQKLLNIYFQDNYTLSNGNLETIKTLVDDQIAGSNATLLIDNGISKDVLVNFYIEEYVEALTRANIQDEVVARLTESDYKIGYFDCVYFDDKDKATEFYDKVKNGAGFKETANEMIKDFNESSLSNAMMKGSLNESLEAVVYDLKQDEIPNIIEASIGGYYVVKCTKPYAVTTDSTEKETVYNSLVKDKTKAKIEAVLKQMEQENTVEVNYDLLDKIQYIYE